MLMFRPGMVKDQSQVVGRYRLEISGFKKDRVHDCVAMIESDDERIARIDYRLTINGSNTAPFRKKEFEQCIKSNRFSAWQTFATLNKIGILEVTVHNARHLPIADKMTLGKSDPYCFINLGKTRFRTRIGF